MTISNGENLTVQFIMCGVSRLETVELQQTVLVIRFSP